tara:strand:- start:784 stop:1212 length:429 start_codon:yes stop_codon:yes gene_type:complete
MIYPFYVNGIDESSRWEKLKSEIWSDLASCEMYRHWEYYDKDEHDFYTYGNVPNPIDLGEFVRCAYCDINGILPIGIYWNLEHVLPRKYYPQLAFDIDNIVVACNRCNKKKCNKVGKSVGNLVLPYQKRLAKKKQLKLLEIA